MFQQYIIGLFLPLVPMNFKPQSNNLPFNLTFTSSFTSSPVTSHVICFVEKSRHQSCEHHLCKRMIKHVRGIKKVVFRKLGHQIDLGHYDLLLCEASGHTKERFFWHRYCKCIANLLVFFKSETFFFVSLTRSAELRLYLGLSRVSSVWTSDLLAEIKRKG